MTGLQIGFIIWVTFGIIYSVLLLEGIIDVGFCKKRIFHKWKVIKEEYSGVSFEWTTWKCSKCNKAVSKCTLG